MKLLLRMVLSLVCFYVLLGLVMFLPAGIGWTGGWIFLGVFFVEMLLMALYVWCTNPEVFVARSKIQKGTKGWDRVLFYVLEALILAIFLVAGFDHRLPRWVAILGYLLLTLGMAGNAWVLGVNKFAEMSVRIQTERGHQVVDTGPYRIVRHPMYATIFLFLIGVPLALGSFWAILPAALSIALLVVRTFLEDRTLYKELAGYRLYAARVRYRLIPGVW